MRQKQLYKKAMLDKLSSYMERLGARFEGDSRVKGDVDRELRSHLEDKTQELIQSGANGENAAKAAIQSFGSSRLIAKQLEEVHGQGSWEEAFCGALPHFLGALLFVSHYWQNTIMLYLVLAAIVAAVIYGWGHDKPLWLFPWLGYWLLSIAISGILLVHASHGWIWLTALLYIPMAIFVSVRIAREAANRDPLYYAMLLLPLPVVTSWLLMSYSGSAATLVNTMVIRLQISSPAIGLSFLFMAIVTIAFIRIRQRQAKTVILLIVPAVASIIVALMHRGTTSVEPWLLWFASMLIFLAPIWWQRRPWAPRTQAQCFEASNQG